MGFTDDGQFDDPIALKRAMIMAMLEGATEDELDAMLQVLIPGPTPDEKAEPAPESEE